MKRRGRSNRNCYRLKVHQTGRGGMETLVYTIPSDNIYIVMVGDAEKKSGSFLMATKTK